MWPRNSTPYIPKGNESLSTQKLYPNCNIIQDSQKVEMISVKLTNEKPKCDILVLRNIS